jgi:hypothetical protein
VPNLSVGSGPHPSIRTTCTGGSLPFSVEFKNAQSCTSTTIRPLDAMLNEICTAATSVYFGIFFHLNGLRGAIHNGLTNALVCNKTLIQMSHTKTLKITPTCFDHQMIIIRELFDPS